MCSKISSIRMTIHSLLCGLTDGYGPSSDRAAFWPLAKNPRTMSRLEVHLAPLPNVTRKHLQIQQSCLQAQHNEETSHNRAKPLTIPSEQIARKLTALVFRALVRMKASHNFFMLPLPVAPTKQPVSICQNMATWRKYLGWGLGLHESMDCQCQLQNTVRGYFRCSQDLLPRLIFCHVA